MARRSILFVSVYEPDRMRATSWEHLRAFQNYSKDDVYYLNLALKETPWYVRTIDFDLIVFHTFFLTQHWGGREHFRNIMRKAESLRKAPSVKVMLPQDEFYCSDLFCEFINEFGIDYVFSVAPESEWKNIYRSVDFSRVKFFSVLTGYLDDQKLGQIIGLGESTQNRPIDVGYRTAGKPYFWFGRHGFLKQQIAEVFQEEKLKSKLVIDVSTRNEDTILGDDWYRFLAKCKYVIGVEGGTSLLDRDGSIRKRTEEYLAAHPEPSFAEVEAACFPNTDGSAELYALSPRHLEPCVTRTCQVLTTGHYNGVLKPGRHYIELKKDFSNIDDVLDVIARDDLRQEIVECAYQDIVASGLYTYRHFVQYVTHQSLADRPLKNASAKSLVWQRIIYHWMYRVEKVERVRIKAGLALLSRTARLRQRLASVVCKRARPCIRSTRSVGDSSDVI